MPKEDSTPPGAKQSRLSDGAVWLIIGNASQMAFSFLLLLALVRILPKEEFGELQWLILLVSGVAVAARLGLPQSYLYLIPRTEESRRRALLTQGLLVQASIGLLVGAGMVAVAWIRPEMFGGTRQPLLLLGLFLFPALSGIVAALLPIMVAIGQPKFSAVISLLQGALYFGFALGAASLAPSAATIFPALTLAYAIATSVGLFLMYRAVSKGSRRLAGWEVLCAQVRYSLPLWASQIVGDLNNRSGGIIVRTFFSPLTFATFSVGAREVPFVNVFSFGITQAILPKISSLGQQNDRAQQVTLWHQAMCKIALVIFPTFVFVFSLADRFIQIVFTEKYLSATSIFMIYLLLLPLRLSGYGAVLAAMGRPRLVLHGAVLGVVTNILIGLGLLPLVGWHGPAIAAVASSALMIMFYVAKIRKVVEFPWSRILPLRRLGPIMLVAVAPMPGAWWLASLMTSSLAGFLGAALVYFPCYLLLAWWFCILTTEDVALVRRWLTWRNS